MNCWVIPHIGDHSKSDIGLRKSAASVTEPVRVSCAIRNSTRAPEGVRSRVSAVAHQSPGDKRAELPKVGQPSWLRARR